MSGRSKEETAGVSLLGNQNVRYPGQLCAGSIGNFCE